MRWVLRAFLCCSQRHERESQICAATTITAVCEYPLCAGVLELKYFSRSVALKTPPRHLICFCRGACICISRYISIYIEVKFTFTLCVARRVSPLLLRPPRLYYNVRSSRGGLKCEKEAEWVSEWVELSAYPG
jgi:hypothetical protein